MLTKKYNSTGGAIASYDYTDIAEGTGVVTFYAGGMAMSGSTLYKLSRNAIETTGESTGLIEYRISRAVMNNSVYENKVEIDFDTNEFNSPRVVEGTMISECPWSYYVAGNYAVTGYIVMTISKVLTDDTEEEIATNISSTIYRGGTEGQVQSKYFTFPTVLPKTQIKRGEKIRITIQLWARKWGAPDPTAAVALLYDPLDRVVAATGTADEGQYISALEGYTQMRFRIPFRIDI